MRHAGVAARVRNKTCYPLGNGLHWTDPEVIAGKEPTKDIWSANCTDSFRFANYIFNLG